MEYTVTIQVKEAGSIVVELTANCTDIQRLIAFIDAVRNVEVEKS